jgi:hypothetical protein
MQLDPAVDDAEHSPGIVSREKYRRAGFQLQEITSLHHRILKLR